MMARKKKARTSPRFAWLRNLDWPTVRPILYAIAWLICISGLIAGGLYGIPRLESHAMANAAIDPFDIDIQFVDPPAWLHGELETRVVFAARSQLTENNPLSRTGNDLPQVRNAILNSGWVQEVHQVRRLRARLIEVHAEFVDPFALVRDRDGDHLVDAQGRLLPRTFPEGHMDKFMVIVGSRYNRPARPGLQWEGNDVAAALQLLRVLELQPWLDQVRQIDVTGQTRARGTGTIRLVTDRGSWLLWGSPPGEEAAMEALVERKLQFMSHNHREFGHIDGNHRGEVDITDHKRVMNR